MHAVELYIRQSLNGLYPESEIKGFTKIIFNEVLHLNMLDIYMGKDIKLSPNQVDEVEQILSRLKKCEPIQYILEQARFCERNFYVNSSVLIPRPETEELVSLIISENPHSKARILDVGTGSGCISVTLSKLLPDAKVAAWDVSEEALQVAKQNNDRFNACVAFDKVNILEYMPSEDLFDIIVSNPPYVTVAEKEEMEHNVLDWEPHLALFVSDEDPLLFYRKIAEASRVMLSPSGKIYFEINQALGNEVRDLLAALGYQKVEIIKDLSGRNRIVKALK